MAIDIKKLARFVNGLPNDTASSILFLGILLFS